MDEERINKELEKLKLDPYSYIPDVMEQSLLHVGKNAFELLCLVPVSHILPDLPFSSSSIRSQMNVLLLAAPSSGKSTLCHKFSKISINPITFRKISARELAEQIDALKIHGESNENVANCSMFTIINEDFTQVAEDYEVIKILEGALGDEKMVSYNVMNRNINVKCLGTGLICGTPTDLMRYLKNLEGGLYSRIIPFMISHTAEQHGEIGRFINEKIGHNGNSEFMIEKEEAILRFYKELRLIQEGKHKIPPIVQYNIPEDMKRKAGDKWNALTKDLVIEMDVYWIRELHEMYRFMLAHAFLNVFNRKIETFKRKVGDQEKEFGILTPTKEDFLKGIELMSKNITFKYYLIKATSLNSKIRDAKTLRSILNSEKVPTQAKNILINISPFTAQLGINRNLSK